MKFPLLGINIYIVLTTDSLSKSVCDTGFSHLSAADLMSFNTVRQTHSYFNEN